MIECHFSPGGKCADKIIELIGGVKKELLIQAYTFTHPGIANAIKPIATLTTFIQDAKASIGSGSLIDALYGMKVKCNLDHLHAIAHNKVMILDHRLLITGSYNFTHAAEFSNAENLLILDDPVIVRQYADNFALHLSHSMPYDPKNLPTAAMLEGPAETELNQQ